MTMVRGLFLVLSLLPAVAFGQAEPLLMEGKQTLHQRVLIRDRIAGADAPGETPAAEAYAPLSPLFVYAREGDWIEVGRDERGQGLSWIPAASAVDWRQNIVLTFEDTERVDQVLFFNDLDSLYEVVEAENPGEAAAGLRGEAESAQAAGRPDQKIVALGPSETVDLRRNLYVMPILEAEAAMFETGAVVNLLKVAVARASAPEAGAAPSPAERRDFRAGIVFVVDTTTSMQRYIDATQAALEAIFRTIAQSSAGHAVSFGLVGFRDHPDAEQPGSYSTQTFAPLSPTFDAGGFLTAIRGMEEAPASNRNFREDSYAGILSAIESLDWAPFDARYIVLVTDAGPREIDDPLSQTRLSAHGLATLARERLGAAIAVLHLQTPAGASDHATAEAAYRALSLGSNREPLYFPVENGDPALYQAAAQRLATLIVDQVAAFREDGSPESPVAGADAMAGAVRSAGRTMELAYLGRIEGTRAPDVFEAYVADRDFARPGLKPVSIRLLLTKAQLSDLEEALGLIVDRAQASVLQPNEFFEQVLGAAADMSRRPEQVARRGDTTIADAATITEYLDGLPYVSRIMNITEDDWLRMSVAEQQTVVNELYDKLERYRRYNEATDQWVDYLGSGGSDALVYPMLLDDLP